MGLSLALSEHDWIVPTHRCHGYTIARGASPAAMFSEMLGSRHGIVKGLGGSMHMSDREHSNLGSSAVVGSGISLAGGIAYALRERGEKAISAAIFGDGASSRGTLHEMMNMASVFHLPLLFFLENNHYGMSASADRMISTGEIHKRAEGYSMESLRVDGNDAEAVFEAVSAAREHILENGGPYFIEADTYRFCGHSRSDRRVYRSREEEESWMRRDPIVLFGKRLLEKGFSSQELEAIRKRAEDEIEAAALKAIQTKDETLTEEEILSFASAPSEKVIQIDTPLHKATYREAIREALDEMLSSPEARLIGEDIGQYGGCFHVTDGLWQKHKERMLETPVSEETFSGMAAGAAALGLHPICEIMYGDFSTLASDAIINHAAKLHFMSAGQFDVPLIFRIPIGGMTGHGAQHTQSLETMFLAIPGLIAAAPSDARTAKAILKAAYKERNPVLFFEHKALYQEQGEAGDENAIMPLGKAVVYDEGDKLLVIGYSRAFAEARKALQGRGCRFIDLVTIKPIDEDTLRSEFRKIGKALIVQDTPPGGSVGEMVLRVLSEAGETHGRVRMLSALSSPIPASESGERIVLLGPDRIRREADILSVMDNKESLS